MADLSAEAALFRLMTWLSPTFPVGSFSYSHGLERAVNDRHVADITGLREWITALVEHGSVWCDTVLLVRSWRLARAGDCVTDTAELAEALAGSVERHRESTLQGGAFIAAAREWHVALVSGLPPECPYCVAVGAVAARHDVSLEQTLVGWLQAFAGNQLQAAIRLSVIGQSAAVSLMAVLEPVILETAERAVHSTLDDLGSSTVLAEISAMKHEIQYSRLFRT